MEKEVELNFFGEDLPLEYNVKNLKGAKPISQDKSTRKKKQPDHTKRTTEYWEARGWRCDKLESWQNVNSSWVRKDFLGFADFLITKKGQMPGLLQICSKSSVRPHLRKMLGNDEIKGGETRRSAFNYYLSLGWSISIQWWDQPSGHGGKWETGVEDVTQSVIDDIDSGKRMKRI